MRLIITSIPYITNVSKNFLPALRFAIALTALIYILLSFIRLTPSGFQIKELMAAFTPAYLLVLLFVFALMFLNWTIEGFKWALLVSKMEPPRPKMIISSILYGISLGMITPKRTGEFAGKIYFLKPENRLNGLLLNSVAGASQLFITLLVGSFALAWFISHWSGDSFSISTTIFRVDLLLKTGFSFTVLLLITIYLLPFLGRIFKRQSVEGASRPIRLLKGFALLKKKDISLLITLSMLRYLVFVCQFYLLLKVFGHPVEFTMALIFIAVIYLIMTLMPLSALWEMGVRGSVALFVFSFYPNEAGGDLFHFSVIAATTTLWIVNLGMPALAGGLLGLKNEFSKNPEE